jgi:hypothetical protein
MEQKLEGLTCGYEGLGVIFQKAPSTLKSDFSRKPETLPPPSIVGVKGRPLWIVADVLDWIRARKLKEGQKRQQPALTASMLNARAHWKGAPKKQERLAAERLGISVREMRRRNAAAVPRASDPDPGQVKDGEAG